MTRSSWAWDRFSQYRHCAPIPVEDFDTIELNEAFAVRSLACIRELHLPEDRVNPDSGAIPSVPAGQGS